MSVWTIDGRPVYKLRRTLRSLAADAVTFETGLNFDADPILSIGGACSIERDGSPWFAGVVTKSPARGSGAAESQACKISGPWWYLEKLVFHQSWNVMTGSGSPPVYSIVSTPRTRLILGQDISGNPISINDQITEILNWAVEKCGVPIAIGDINVSTVCPPANERVNITCAEAIKAVLRWTPDAIGWWDYSQAAPRLNICRASALGAVNVPLQSPWTGLAITPRQDLVCPSVCINYEQTVTVDTDAYTTLVQDYQPDGATGLEVGALCATIELSGPATSYQHQPVVTRPVPGSSNSEDDGGDDNPEDGAGNPTGCLSWWRSRKPWMRQYQKADGSMATIPVGDISIVANTHAVDLDAADAADAGNNSDDPNSAAETAPDSTPAPPDAPGDISEVTRELVSGALCDWMQVKAAPATAYAWATYTPQNTPDPAVAALFGASNALPLIWNYTATDAVSQTYRCLNGYNVGEAVPTGVAAMLYAAVSILYYEGSVTSEEAEVGGAIGLGNAINLTGGRSEWTGMNAPVQTVTEDVDAGRTEIGFGPASHLSPRDLVELLRGARRRKPSARGNGGERKTSAPTNRANVTGASRTPTGNTPPLPAPSAAGPVPFQVLDATDAGGPKVRVVFGTISPQGAALGGGVNAWPGGMTVGDDPQYILPVSGTGVVYLGVSVDTSASYTITSLYIDQNAAIPNSDENNGYLLLSPYAVASDNKSVTGLQPGVGNQTYTFTRCRDWFSYPATYSAGHAFAPA